MALIRLTKTLTPIQKLRVFFLSGKKYLESLALKNICTVVCFKNVGRHSSADCHLSHLFCQSLRTIFEPSMRQSRGDHLAGILNTGIVGNMCSSVSTCTPCN